MKLNHKKLAIALFFSLLLVVTLTLLWFRPKAAVERRVQPISDEVRIPAPDTTLVIDCGPIPGSQEGHYVEEEEITKDSHDVR